MGYNSWGHKELDMTKQLTHTHTHTHTHRRGCGENITGAAETGRSVLRRRVWAPFLKPLSGMKLHG